jgi:hypothetical protein
MIFKRPRQAILRQWQLLILIPHDHFSTSASTAIFLSVMMHSLHEKRAGRAVRQAGCVDGRAGFRPVFLRTRATGAPFRLPRSRWSNRPNAARNDTR